MAAVTFMSCNSDGENRYEQTYPRNMIIAVSDPSGQTEYTATAVGYKFDIYNLSKAEVIIATLKKPDGMVYSMASATELSLGTSTTNMDYTFNSSKLSSFTNFITDTPLNLSGTLSALGWSVSNTSNASLMMSFNSGDKLAGFGADLGFFTNTSVYDSQNPSAEPFKTNDATTNNVRIVLAPSTKERTATVYMYQANFDKDMKKKIDFMIEDVEYNINTANGVISFRKDEAIPYLLSNNVKGDPMPSYKITDLECTVFDGFTTPGMFRFNCADRYELTATLSESLPNEEDK